MTVMKHEATLSSTLSPLPEARRRGGGKLAIAIVLVGAVLAFLYFDLGRYLTLETLQANRDRLLLLTEAHFAATAGIFVAVYCLVTGLSLPGAVILTLAGGFLFGSVLGTLLVNVGATTGATLAFLASRYLLRDWVETKFGSRLAPFQEGFSKNAFNYLLTLRLIPLFPFFLVNMVSGLTRVSPGTYISATAMGIIPGSFVYAFAGRELGTIQSLAEIASPSVLLAFTLLGILALAPIVYKRFGRKP
jgi:uncharacterized membrane protein YdjX (TVP38/TMEM64 family)